ncbi:hypothetical protein FRB90_000354 [Tulasnella sp. 427]|nr:hypothetical protein FRB90_000354 [Tulasnella sp. 427]
MHRQPRRQDTFQLHDQHQQQQSTQHTYQQQQQQQQVQMGRQQQQQQQQQQYAQQSQQGGQYYADEEEHSIMDDDSGGEEQYIEDEDGSSSLSVPSESIDFDLVYSIQTFVATVEGQANVVKGDSLVLMDDSNSYWWLVRVLKTGEVGYIPAENIETAFERLARLNKHRNVDLASATQVERQENPRVVKERMRAMAARNSPYPPEQPKSVIFTGSFMVHQYPAFIWGNENDVLTSDEEEYDSYEEGEHYEDNPDGMEPDDGMSWDESAGQRAQEERMAEASRDPRLQQQQDGGVPASLRPGQGQASQQQQRAGQPASNQAELGLGTAPSVRAQPSRDRVQSGQQQDPRQQGDGSSPSGRPFVDPLESGETRKISATPNIARGPSDSSSRQQQEPAGKRSTSPASVAQQRSGSQQALHRSISTESAGSIGSRDSSKKSAETSSVSSKIKKSGRTTPDDESGGEGGATKEKKKKTGMFSGLFSSKKKDNKKEKGGKGITNSPGTDGDSYGRGSEDSSPSNNNSPAEQSTATFPNRRAQPDARKPSAPASSVSQVSAHASRLAQKDLQEQALYQQYLNRSPASPPDPTLSYGLQSAATLGLAPSNTNNSLTAERPRNSRPGSLIITNNMLEGAMVPELSVMRVFAGENLQSEATFKTVLLNSTTTSAELVRQAMQRFRLPHAEDPADYFLTIKQYEGEEATLLKEEKPLEIFEELVETALNLPTIKRSSISSISSNLSMQSAITKLAMNDFTDDSTVKLYLNRKPTFSEGLVDIPDEDGVTPTRSMEGPSIRADDSMTSIAPHDPVDAALSRLNGRPVTNPGLATPERFSAPAARFSMQVIIYPEDLPDGLVFDPQTEAIVPRASLQSRPPASVTPAQGVNQQYRKKVFVFPKNTTVAEVIEQSLDMFGIQEGVVDGGDEIEDKVLKHMSKTRVRYGLAVHMPNEGGGRELHPSSKVLEAFPRPPTFKQQNRRSADLRRRSLDASQLLGSMDDVQPGDPVFILKRATTYRSSASRNRLSAPLDDVALHHVHQRESILSENSIASEYTSMTESPASPRLKQPQLSQRELIAAQRAASRANQSAMLDAKPNAEQGVDLLLPDKGVIRSARSGVDERMLYSYVQPDGETYDISDIIEEELWDVGQDRRSGGSRAGRPSIDDDDDVSPTSVGRAGSRIGNRGDLLEDVLVKPRDVVEQRIDQVLAKIKDNKRASSLVSYGTDGGKQPSKSFEDRRSPTPRSGSATGRRPGEPSGSRSNTPSHQGRGSPHQLSRDGGTHSQQASIASLMSDYTPDNSTGMKSSTTERTTPGTANRPPIILKDDFGLSKMMAVIEANANSKKPPPQPPMTEVEELLFGSNLQLEDLHPAARDLFAPMFERMESVNKV